MTLPMGVGGPIPFRAEAAPPSPTETAWFTAAELAALKLPGLSAAKRKINELARDEGWALKTDRAGRPLARPREGQRGGGLEYALQLLPARAVAELVRRGLAQPAPLPAGVPVASNDAEVESPEARMWRRFDAQSAAVKAEARRRLEAVQEIEALETGGLTRTAAVAAVAASAGVGASTLWQWLTLAEGVSPSDRLPLLAPRRQGGGKAAEVDPGAWRFLVSDYLRPERPTFASCWWRCQRDWCEPRGLTLPHPKTLLRKLEREVDERLITAKRHGADALRAMIPAQTRSVADLHALELVNIDGHRWDVFVKWPDGRIARPTMVAIQDVMSRKILSWRIDETESAVLTRLAFADLFARWGIPKACLMDNGRAFASKWITGGVSNRFRFAVKEEEPTGLLTSLGVGIHWALPFRGSSKPIERAFRDLCDTVAKHPAFAGAYTGNRPDAKPENYGSKAIDLETFKSIVTREIAAHNARPGRRTEAAGGTASFDDVFAASYAAAPIGKASAAQLRLALLASKVIGTDRKDGSVRAYGNVWWSEALSAHRGKKVVLRYDPDDLTAPVHVYDLADRFLATAELQGRTAFLDAGAAQRRARQEAQLRRDVRRVGDLQDLMSAEDLAAFCAATEAAEAPPPEPSVIRPVRVRGGAQPRVAVDADAPSLSERMAAAVERMPSLRVVE
jgi:putative transposase